jgi:hypothetical protein
MTDSREAEAEEVALADVGLGATLVVDVAVFHRAGVDGACHVEEAVEYVVADDPAENEEVGAYLTVAQEEALPDSLVGVMYSLTLPVADPEAHPEVYEVQEVRPV